MSILIEKATPADAAAMLDYLKQIGAETDNLTFGAEGLPVTVEEEAAYIAQLETSHDSIMLLAKEHGEIIGNASVSRLPRRMSHRGDISLAVVKAHWNKGVGSQLLCRAMEFAKENVFAFLDLQVRSDNLRAIRLYEKHGFQKIGTHPAFLKIGSQVVAFDFMCLPLKGDVAL